MTTPAAVYDEHGWVGSLADLLDPPESPYKGKPVEWTRERVGEWLTEDQQAVMNSVAEHRYTAVQSCHGVGKSFSAARLVAWWLDTHPPGEAFVVTTAPTAPQVAMVLWREIGKVHRKADLFGYLTSGAQPAWKISGSGEPIAYGRKPADYDPSAFQGIHARYVLVIVDEANGVPKALYDAIDSLATNVHARVLAIGNPDSPSSHFALICKPGSGWHVIRIDALRQCTFTKSEVAKYPRVKEYMQRQGIKPSTEPVPEDVRGLLSEMLVDPLWVDERLKRWGESSPTFQSKVRGLFPKVSIDTLIHPQWVTMAQAREAKRAVLNSKLGVDVARYGVNHTIIFLRQGGWCRIPEGYDIPYGPTTQTAGLVLKLGRDLAQEHSMRMPTAFVDDTGVGGGVTDILVEAEYPVVPIVPGSAGSQLLPNGKPRFSNLRSELMWNLREALSGPSETGEDGWLDIDPLDEDLAAQLSNIKYKINSKGQIQVESKEEMEARGLPSPDRADALCYSLAPDQAPAHVETRAMITSDLLDRKW